MRLLCILSLFTAYLLMFAHSVIPHHHHEDIEEADHHHYKEMAMQQDHEDGHEAHFVHPPDAGFYLAVSSTKVKCHIQYHTLFIPATIVFSDQQFIAEVDWFPDLPPPDADYKPSVLLLRGPPVLVS